MKFIGRLLVIILIIVAVLFVSKNVLLKFGIEKGVEAFTGLPLEIKSLDVNMSKTLVHIQGVRLGNPKGFPEKVFLDLPEVYVDYDLPALLHKEIHLNEVRFDLKEFSVVKNKDGQVNLDSFKALQKEPSDEKKVAAPETPEKKEKGQPMPIKIDVFELKIGKVYMKDYSKGEKPSIKEYDININEKFTNITDPKTLAGIIVVKALANTTIGSLINFDISGVTNMVGGALGSAKDLTKGAVDQGSKALKQTTEGIKNLIKMPFGGSGE